MEKQKDIELGYKIWLIEECLANRMRGREAARRAGVSCSCMQKWISRYKAEGTAAFQKNNHRRVYSEAIKRMAVEDYLSGKGSLLTISEAYKIRAPGLILDWVRVYNRHNEANKNQEEPTMANKYTLEFRVQIVKEHLKGERVSAILPMSTACTTH